MTKIHPEVSQKARDAAERHWEVFRDLAVNSTFWHNESAWKAKTASLFQAFERDLAPSQPCEDEAALQERDDEFVASLIAAHPALEGRTDEPWIIVGFLNAKLEQMTAECLIWKERAMRQRIEASQPQHPASEDARERATEAVAKAWYGPNFDPFSAPEYWAMAETVADAVLAALSQPQPAKPDAAMTSCPHDIPHRYPCEICDGGA